MVFANLSHDEKDAFFSLLDEYFQSRPELAAKLSGTGSGSAGAHVNNAMNRMSAAAHSFGSSNSQSAPPRHSPTQAPSDRGPTGLLSSKRFGDVDTTSKMSMLTSSLSKRSGSPSVQTPPPAPAFTQPKNTFAPPPRRTASAAPDPEPPQGDWAEALYDYDSGEAGDLSIKANQRVLVTEKSSSDWWKGEVDGRSGLFPASYVKLL